MCCTVQNEYNWTSLVKDVLVPFTAVFLAAFLAFWIDRSQRKKVEKDKKIEAAHFLLFVLSQQFQFLTNLKKNQSHVESSGGFILLVPDCPKVGGDDLGFIVRDDANLVNKAMLASRKYFFAIVALEQFNQQEAIFQEFVGKHAVAVDQNIVESCFTEREVPQFKTIKSKNVQYFENLKQSVDWALVENKEIYPQLIQYFIKKFRGEKFSVPEDCQYERIEKYDR